MKFISWNVNGLRACLGKDFLHSVQTLDADVISLQETKMMQGQAEVNLPDYQQYWNSAQRKGYSGTAIFSRVKPLSERKGIEIEEFDQEGRAITLEYKYFYLVNVYTPNSRPERARMDYRMRWEDALRDWLMRLDQTKPVVLCGDLNVAHQEIDLRNPKTNHDNPGFTDEEREKMTQLLGSGFRDTFRLLYPDREGAYTWWSYRSNARKNNTGWRIDYFIVSARLMPKVVSATIHPDILGSDHCPVGLELDF